MPVTDEAQSFLLEVQRAWGRRWLADAPGPSPDYSAYVSEVEADAKNAGVLLDDASHRGGGLDSLIQELANQVAAQLEIHDRSRLQNRTAFGGIDSPTVNAACVKSRDGVFAIVVNFGLMIFLNKYTKYMTAAAIPSSVAFCNRANPDDLGRSDYVMFANEMIDHYRTTGEIAGALIRLSQRGQALSVVQLILAERFVVAHEIGHFLCGHLDDDSLFSLDSTTQTFLIFAENEHHQKEFEADARAFELMAAQLWSAARDEEALEAVGAGMLITAVTVFQALQFLGSATASRTHPAPRERLLRLAEAFYDKRSFESVRAWLDAGIANHAPPKVKLRDPVV